MEPTWKAGAANTQTQAEQYYLEMPAECERIMCGFENGDEMYRECKAMVEEFCPEYAQGRSLMIGRGMMSTGGRSKMSLHYATGCVTPQVKRFTNPYRNFERGCAVMVARIRFFIPRVANCKEGCSIRSWAWPPI